jgi:hypothetical protein
MHQRLKSFINDILFGLNAQPSFFVFDSGG